MRVVDAFHAVAHQLFNFFRGDRAAATTENFNVRSTKFPQPVDHVTEELQVPTLIRTDCYAIGIFLNRRTHNVVNTAVMTEVHDLRAARLDQASHDINGGVVTVKQGGGGHKS